MGASQTKQQVDAAVALGKQSDKQTVQSHSSLQGNAFDTKKMPELRVSTETWTRESHGLYDFEGNEVNTANFSIKGTHNISRSDSTIIVNPVDKSHTFEEDGESRQQTEKDQVIARCLFRQNSYWIYHKNLVDETSEAVLERKPEEKIWQVVKQTHPPEMDFPCYRLRRRDLIKVGRVRFKIRDIMSPVYQDKNKLEDLSQQKFKQIYPSYDLSSINDVSAMDHSQISQVQPEELQPVQAQQAQHEESLDEDTESEAEPTVELNQEQQEGTQPQSPQLAATTNDLVAQLTKKRTKVPKLKQQQLLLQVEKEKVQPKDEQAVCRICLTEEEESDNPLLSPCKCAGSMRFIHHQCLKQWFHQRRVMKQSQIVTTYFWKNLECELCKQAYPYETKSLDGRHMLNIIEYDLPQDTQFYIVLESISSNTSKVIHVLNMQSTYKLFIGRGHDAHVRVTDISVSRLHAILFKAANGYFYLTDNESKFGTLALVRSPIQLQPKSKTQLQISRTLMNIEVKEVYSNLWKNCLCLGNSGSKDNNSKDKESGSAGQQDFQLMSLDGIDYFPQEFASQDYIKLMSKRKAKQSRALKYKSKQQSTLLLSQKPNQEQNNHNTTQQNESVLDAHDSNDDLRANDNSHIPSRSAEIIRADVQEVVSDLHHSIGRESSEGDEEDDDEDEDDSGRSDSQSLVDERDSEDSRGEEDSKEDGDGDEDSQSESEYEQVARRRIQARRLIQASILQRESQQLEQAIQESLVMQHNLTNSRDVSKIQIKDQPNFVQVIQQLPTQLQSPQLLEESKQSILQQSQEEVKEAYQDNDSIEGKQKLPLRLDDMLLQENASNISTSRMSLHNPLQELKSKVLLQNVLSNQKGMDVKNVTGEECRPPLAPLAAVAVTVFGGDEQSDQTILHDMPTQVYAKQKAFGLNEKPQTQRAQIQKGLVGPPAANLKSQRTKVDIARQIIIEHEEDYQDNIQSPYDHLQQRPESQLRADTNLQQSTLVAQPTLDANCDLPFSATKVQPPQIIEVESSQNE